jgi:hypothetical protein
MINLIGAIGGILAFFTCICSIAALYAKGIVTLVNVANLFTAKKDFHVNFTLDIYRFACSATALFMYLMWVY